MYPQVRSRLAFLVIAALSLSVFGGCTAIDREIKYGKLKTQTKMSETIFLEPMSLEKRIVWIEVRNTSEKEIAFQDALRNAIAVKGFQITDDPEAANYQLQVNVLFVGEADETAIHGSLYAGFGGPVLGISTGLLAGAASRSSRKITAAAGLGGLLVGGIAEAIGNAAVRVMTYSVVTDIQVSQRSSSPVVEQGYTQLPQGRGAQLYQQTNGASNWRRYRVRVASTATQTNLKFEEAQYDLISGLVRSVSGIL